MAEKPRAVSLAAEGRLLVETICRRLRGVYGRVEPPTQWPVLDELVATILSQNTTDANSDAAYQELRRRFPDWHSVRRAPVERIAAAIRTAGLAQSKAPRIRAILRELQQSTGELSLEFLHSMSDHEAAEYLGRFEGVGPKTAACVLLFACRKPVLPVDTHVHRVSRRLGLIAPRTSAAAAHRQLAAIVPAARVLEFHVQLIRHGRRTCAARKPRCNDCPLAAMCAYVTPETPTRRSR